jgi:hypothetical protein
MGRLTEILRVRHQRIANGLGFGAQLDDPNKTNIFSFDLRPLSDNQPTPDPVGQRADIARPMVRGHGQQCSLTEAPRTATGLHTEQAGKATCQLWH